MLAGRKSAAGMLGADEQRSTTLKKYEDFLVEFLDCEFLILIFLRLTIIA